MKSSLTLAIAFSMVTTLSAATATPKGDYVLLDQGVAGGQNFALLGLLTLDGAGNAAGTEVFRTGGNATTSKVTGTYTMSSHNSGTLTLTVADPDSEAAPAVQNYRFLIGSDGDWRAIRIDPGVLSVSSLATAQAISGKGSFAVSELDRNSALLAQVALDGNGALSGSAFSFSTAGAESATLSGSYVIAEKGLSTLTMNVTTKDIDGNDVITTHTYRVAATEAGIKAIRIDAGAVAVADLEAL